MSTIRKWQRKGKVWMLFIFGKSAKKYTGENEELPEGYEEELKKMEEEQENKK